MAVVNNLERKRTLGTPISMRSKRIYRQSMVFNSSEMSTVEFFFDKYKIQNRGKFFRETIITAMLQKLEQDHPRLF
ncbi:hypothetical protein [Alistipes sp. ZOR0009]|jgi:hypothetical protein|uniref:hypothetical protein n=1 Tax=Alistipes sp. ZOR0009 TaxID=1339253 RepID=UPI000646636A|nr:hypothetical protein [Alistipes sp. ZOR0009]